MWDAIKERRCQKRKNAMLDVDKHVNQLRLEMLLVPSCSHGDVQRALEAVTPEDVQAFHSQLLKDCHLEALIEGNVSRSDAVATVRCAITHYSCCSSLRVLCRYNRQGCG
jgi:secreted Zn-dependent insulinase-like peptidase